MASVYVHIPFCRQKCTYCNFYSSTRCGEIPLFLQCLEKEIRLKADALDGQPPASLYIGGGTPSLLQPPAIQQIITEVKKVFGLEAGAEITMEANPNHLTEDYFRALRDTEVNRLSIGVQSLSDEVLRRIRRLHTAAQAEAALDNALKYGFTRLSADLIYGLPGSTQAQWEADVRRLSALPHLSCYQLTVEPGSAIYLQLQKGLEQLPTEEETEAQYAFLLDFLKQQGFTHYEVSNFCKGEAYSRHNTAYWQGKPYVGLGPGAHSFYGGFRRWNLSDVQAYCRLLADFPAEGDWKSLENKVFEQEEITSEMAYEEYVMTSLRTCWGCDLERVRTQWGEDHHRHVLQQLSRYPAHYYTLQGNALVLTESGLRFADGIAADFFL